MHLNLLIYILTVHKTFTFEIFHQSCSREMISMVINQALLHSCIRNGTMKARNHQVVYTDCRLTWKHDH